MYLYSLGYTSQSFGYAEDFDKIDPYDIYDVFMDELWNEYQDNADFLISVGGGIEVYTNTVEDVDDVNSSRKSKSSRTVYANSVVTKFYSQGDECTFQPNQEEYKLLEELADKLMELSPNGFKYWVKDVYLDHGSKWMWTTVVAEDTVSPYFQSTYQALSPAEWLALMNGEDVTSVAESVLSDKYCPDKIRSSRNIRSGKPICSSTSYDNDALNRIEKLANTYQHTSMLRDDSEVEIDLIDDEYWICDYSESRGSSEPVRMACYADEVSRDEVIGLCKKNGWAYSM
jgi:hypothetical protein